MRTRVHSAASNGHLECLKYLREEVKAPWDSWTAAWAAQNGHLHILEYLVERKYDQFNVMRVGCGRERPLRLFEVLTRNRQGAVGLLRRTRRAQEQPTRVCTIPPRQQLSFTRRLVYRRWRVTRTRSRHHHHHHHHHYRDYTNTIKALVIQRDTACLYFAFSP